MKRWYTNPYVVITILISLLALATASLTFLLIPSSAEIVRQAQARFIALRSYQADVELRYRSDRESDGSSFVLRNRGFHETGDGPAKNSMDAFRLVMNPETPEELIFGGERRRMGTGRFWKFSELPERVGAVRLGRFKDQWLRVDESALFAQTDLPLVGAGRQPLSDLDRATLDRDFRATPFVSVSEVLPIDRLGSIQTYHFKVRPEPLFFRGFYALAESLRLGRELTDAERSAIEVRFADIAPEDGELWIGKSDRQLHRARFRFRIDDGRRRGTFDFGVELSRFDEPVKVAGADGTIQDATPFLESLLLGLRDHLPLAKVGEVQRESSVASGLPVQIIAEDRSDPDHDGLPNMLEVFYLTDPANADTDGDGMNDGDEVAAGRNPSGPGALFDFGLTR